MTVDALLADQTQKIQKMLRVRLGEDVYSSWFERLAFDRISGTTLHASVPVKFLKSWIQSHYADDLLACCRSAIPQVEKVDVQLRTPTPVHSKSQAVAPSVSLPEAREPLAARSFSGERPTGPRTGHFPGGSVRTSANGFEGSPLDPRYTFDNYIVGPANRMAHAAAIQVAETVFADERGFNPLFLHSAVGLGKSHLLHAIAWEVKRRTPTAQVLYLTAERFLFTFVEALKAHDAMAFKDRFRSIDILLIDDLEFMQGEKTEQEFEHIVNALLDGGKQVVVASARPPAQIERLNERMRSRLSRGLVTEISPLDSDLRMKILERRVSEKRAHDPLFEIPRPVLEILADRLTESGRELEGAVNR
ncbi:MAG: DnaA/Hda family protein, partial [Usitatibacteraceae bacterium]